MNDIKKWEQKMQEKRKQTPWRDFVKEICSRWPYNFYKRDGIITVYKNQMRIPHIVSAKKYNKNRDEYCKGWINYNSEISFFENFVALLGRTELPNTTEFKENEWSEFANIVAEVKNVYLSFTVTSWSENILYSSFIKGHSKDVLGSVSITQNSSNVYQSVGINQSNNIFYSKFIDNSNNIRFSSNLIGCYECLFCNDIQNQSYCINNIMYPKEEYKKKKLVLLKDKKWFDLNYQSITKTWININSTNVEWEAIYYSQNIHKSRFVSYINNGWNLYLVGGNEPLSNIYDTFGSASWTSNHCYAWAAHASWDNHYCNYNSAFGSNLYYSRHCESCSFVLWCIGLRNKSFCILNKQYTKEERYELANKIFAQMDTDWTLWSYFPASMNPFYFNDTAAYLIDDSFTKEEVEAEWYLRRDEEIKVDIPAWAEIVYSHKVEGQKSIEDFQWFDSDWNRQINPEILKKVIQDEKWNYYRIVPMELEFLQKHSLPLPEIHWLDRIKLWFKFE
jgi:hypothetical protein